MARLIVLCALLAAVAAVSGAVPSPDGPASDIYLKIKGIEGDADNDGIAVTGLAWDRDAAVGQFALDPPQEILARYGGAQFAGGGMAAGIAVNDSGVGNKPPRREVVSPRDASSGMATGRRQHSYMKIRKEWDAATPLLMKACADGTHIDVEVYQRNESDVSFLRYTLKEAIITSISLDRGEDGSSPPTESVTFTFDKIEMSAAAPAAATNLNSSKSN